MSTVVVNGFFVGLIYGLIGVGFVIVYRGSRVINFAYGETGMIAAFVYAELRFGAVGAGDSRGSLWLAIAVALAVGFAIGAATEWVVARPLRDAPRLRPLIGTFAVGSLLLVFGIRQWGTDPRYLDPFIDGSSLTVAGLAIQNQQLLILAAAVFTLGGLWWLYQRTAFGLRLRATALDPYAAGLVGVNVDRTSILAWGLAGLLSAASAILIAPLVAFNVFFMTALMVRGLAAALVGGLTNPWGAMAAGVIIGVFEGGLAFSSPVTGVTDAAVAVFVLVLMLVRPTGLVRSAY